MKKAAVSKRANNKKVAVMTHVIEPNAAGIDVGSTEMFVAVHVDLSPGHDLTDGRALLASYEQRGLPLVVLHDSQGREVHRVVEFVEPDELLGLMQDVD